MRYACPYNGESTFAQISTHLWKDMESNSRLLCIANICVLPLLQGFMLTTWLGEGRNEKLARTQRLLADGILTPLSGGLPWEGLTWY